LKIARISEEFHKVILELRKSINANSVEITRIIANNFGNQIKRELIKKMKEEKKEKKGLGD